jgi:hypothetical protein
MPGLVSLALLHNAATLASGDVFRMNSWRNFREFYFHALG